MILCTFGFARELTEFALGISLRHVDVRVMAIYRQLAAIGNLTSFAVAIACVVQRVDRCCELLASRTAFAYQCLRLWNLRNGCVGAPDIEAGKGELP